jgi:hypothetical protein
MAAREFGAQPNGWRFGRGPLLARNWLEDKDVAWQADFAGPVPAFDTILAEIEELKMLMQDDRDRYLAESEVQADGLADYVVHFIGASGARHPWTLELISAGLAIGNIVYMHYKAHFKRVRPSFLCPGLITPFGPPAHPAFPSGHSFLGHLIALLLLEIPALAQRYGIFKPPTPTNPAPTPGAQPGRTSLAGTGEIPSPLLWLAQRLAKNRERIGCHYFSDSTASRHLAAGIWWALLHDTDPANRIVCPTLATILVRAKAEWPTDWP